MSVAIAYFITFHGYGTWLHGRAEGSVDRDHCGVDTPFMPPDAERERFARGELKYPPVLLDAERRYVVDATVREVCTHREWLLHTVHVRTTHVHVIVKATHTPERVMNDLKAYCTRRMREAKVLGRDIEPWSHHGSTRYLDSANSFRQAMTYVNDEQGAPLEMRCPVGWVPRVVCRDSEEPTR